MQVVDAISKLDDMLDVRMVGIKKVPGGSVTDSFLVDGVAFKKTFAYAGFEQQQKVSGCLSCEFTHHVHFSIHVFFCRRNSQTPKFYA